MKMMIRYYLKWSALGTSVGVAAGASAWLFLSLLSWIIALRLANPTLLFALPVIGVGVGWLYSRYAGAAVRGNSLIIEQIHQNNAPIPLQMFPLILIGTLATHLGGGSAGREGTGVQMAGSMAEGLYRLFRLPLADRRLMLMAGIAGGFSAVFGTPFGGFIFGLESLRVGSFSYEGVIPCLVAAIIGDLTAHALGIRHEALTALPALPTEPLTVIRIIALGVAAGLVALLFIELLHWIKSEFPKVVKSPLVRPFIGGCAVIVLTLIVGSQDYLGLSLELASRSLQGEQVSAVAWLLKLLFTAITLGTGFVGGEVTPMFAMGASLGVILAVPLGLPLLLSAAAGFLAVFAAASNAPLAMTVVGIELFGGGSAVYLLIACYVGYLVCGHRTIYSAQPVVVRKFPFRSAVAKPHLSISDRPAEDI